MDFEEKLNNAAEKIEDEIDELKETNDLDDSGISKLGKAILGDDGKFDKEDVDRLIKGAKESKLGKAIFGGDE